ncbi:PREDICTED: uncharacterized protein LOC103374843 [Xyrichtys novacula]|uniref:PREDICTED: uncharacterized protein LOC103374843 n=1 Tax=Xyrichtys novacula TaxID=13765 RepID=A0AAV1HI04_XYRNO|nr:PREDICTED: uncharacterized protein LOC103374843 [Xyrichtys novacula]
MYKGTRTKVVTSDGISEEFEILAGVQQVDSLAPFLFIIARDYALRKAFNGREQELNFTITPRKSRRSPAVALADLDYADDICLMSDCVEQEQELLNRVEVKCAKVGLRLNVKETEVITYNSHMNHPPINTLREQMFGPSEALGPLEFGVQRRDSDLEILGDCMDSSSDTHAVIVTVDPSPPPATGIALSCQLSTPVVCSEL